MNSSSSLRDSQNCVTRKTESTPSRAREREVEREGEVEERSASNNFTPSAFNSLAFGEEVLRVMVRISPNDPSFNAALMTEPPWAPVPPTTRSVLGEGLEEEEGGESDVEREEDIVNKMFMLGFLWLIVDR